MDQEDVPNKDIAEFLGIYCQKVETCLKKAREMGQLEALNDLPRSGAPSRITMEARGWVVYLAWKSQLYSAMPKKCEPIRACWGASTKIAKKKAFRFFRDCHGVNCGTY